jgi:hypothetical protein
MADIERRTISLPAEHAAFIDRLVASGGYASASEVVHAGLLADRREGGSRCRFCLPCPDRESLPKHGPLPGAGMSPRRY